MKVTHFKRTAEQDKALGLYAANSLEEGGAAALMEDHHDDDTSDAAAAPVGDASTPSDDAAGAGAGAGAGGAADGHHNTSDIEGDSGTNWRTQKEGGTIKTETDRAQAGPTYGQKGQYVPCVHPMSLAVFPQGVLPQCLRLM
jgi:hypothetical protein